MRFLKIRRLLALFLDISIITIGLSIILDFIFVNIFTEESYVYIITFSFTYTIFYFALFITKDFLFKNASLGKKIFGIAIFSNDEIPSKKVLFKRVINKLYLFPFIPFMIMKNNKTFGDIKYNTIVNYNRKK